MRCDYTAIELGENFTDFMKNKFGEYPNFHIVNADFETYDFEEGTFDLIFSAATIQWIPEKIAFSKCFKLLKPGGYLAMFMTRSDEKSGNEALYEKIQEIYEAHFHVKEQYNCRLEYNNVMNYGFINFNYCEWKKERILTADEYIDYISTHCAHITLEEPYKSAFYSGVRQAILEAGNQIKIMDTIPLYLVQKPYK